MSFARSLCNMPFAAGYSRRLPYKVLPVVICLFCQRRKKERSRNVTRKVDVGNFQSTCKKKTELTSLVDYSLE